MSVHADTPFDEVVKAQHIVYTENVSVIILSLRFLTRKINFIERLVAACMRPNVSRFGNILLLLFPNFGITDISVRGATQDIFFSASL